jgi:hypothetical protein
MPTVVQQGALISGTNPYDAATIVVHGASISGIEDLQVEASLGPTFYDYEEDTTTGFITGDLLVTTGNITTEYETADTVNTYIKTVTAFLTSFKLAWFNDTATDLYYNADYIDWKNDTETNFKIYRGTVRTNTDVDIEFFLHNDRRFIFNFDLYCVLLATPRYLNMDMESDEGRVTSLLTDLYSAYEIKKLLFTDLFCSAANDVFIIDVDVKDAAGRIGVIDFDCFSSVSGTSSAIGCDIRTWSLNTADFFLDVGEYTTVSATAWVDVVDPLKGVSTSGTYFKVDGVPVSVTFSGINNGYRMFYNPTDDFDTEGSLVYTAHIRNLVGDVKDVNYYLLKGYNVTHDETIDWGPNKQVDIWMKATNLGFCPETETDAYYFVTKELVYTDIGATIRPVVSVDLGSAIYPQGPFFFYGGTYTVTISGVKDFAGNEMAPFINTFTIEDPTS